MDTSAAFVTGSKFMDYLLCRDSNEAATKAPPNPELDKDGARHSKAPCFRQVGDRFIYVEEGEMQFADHPFPNLQPLLRERGMEIRRVITSTAGSDVRYKIRDHCVVVVRPSSEPEEVPLTKWRSKIIDEFMKGL